MRRRFPSAPRQPARRLAADGRLDDSAANRRARSHCLHARDWIVIFVGARRRLVHRLVHLALLQQTGTSGVILRCRVARESAPPTGGMNERANEDDDERTIERARARERQRERVRARSVSENIARYRRRRYRRRICCYQARDRVRAPRASQISARS